MNTLWLATLVALSFAFSACRDLPQKKKEADKGDEADAQPATVSAPTYHGQVKAILDAKCAGCHLPGGAAPFPLQSYQDAQTHASAIKASTQAKRMPPWLASRGCNDYQYDVSLTTAELDVIARWVDAGAAEGTPDPAATPVLPLASKMSRVDKELPMPVEYTPTKAPDEYRCFVIDWTPDATTYVTGFGTRPGNTAIVHHVIAFLVGPNEVPQLAALEAEDDEPGYTCFGGPRTSGFPGWVGAWAPGLGDADYPAGTGLKIEAGAKIVLQMHYNLAQAPQPAAGLLLHDTDALPGVAPDRSTVLLKLDASVTKEAYVLPWANYGWLANPQSMKIPAGAANAVHSFGADPTPMVGGKGFDIHMAFLHMHQLGKAGILTVERGGEAKDDTCLLDIKQWDFHWQYAYWLQKPVRFEPGWKLGIECQWDNSKGTKDVTWGEGTGDEMCLGGAYVTLAD